MAVTHSKLPPDALFKAMGHPARLQIASILRQGEACVCHLEARLRLPQPYISQQLTVLRRAGLVNERREGTYMFYRLADERVERALTAVLEGTPQARAPASVSGVACPCPQCSTGSSEDRPRTGKGYDAAFSRRAAAGSPIRALRPEDRA
jgi:ArsR family transcriptional regulator